MDSEMNHTINNNHHQNPPEPTFYITNFPANASTPTVASCPVAGVAGPINNKANTTFVPAAFASKEGDGGGDSEQQRPLRRRWRKGQRKNHGVTTPAGPENKPPNSRHHHSHHPHHHHNRRRRRGAASAAGGGRLWRLPEASIQEYAQWIEEKPLQDQSHAEQQFLWKYRVKCYWRKHRQPKETLKDFLQRVEAKGSEITPLEEQLLLPYRRRRAMRRAEKRQGGVGVPPPIFWTRNNNNPSSNSSSSNAKKPASSLIHKNIASLRESMDRLGLSSDKLLDATPTATNSTPPNPFSFSSPAPNHMDETK